MFFNGHKTSIPTHLPKAILGNVEILKNAPLPAIQAGFGDIIGKYSSLNDWKLASLLYNEYFCDYIYELVQSALNKVVENAEKNFFGRGEERRKNESNKDLLDAMEIYINSRKFEIIDPLNIKKLKEEFENGILDFIAEVDQVLTESNSTTMIQISKSLSDL
jgi:hypothetical protein